MVLFNAIVQAPANVPVILVNRGVHSAWEQAAVELRIFIGHEVRLMILIRSNGACFRVQLCLF